MHFTEEEIDRLVTTFPEFDNHEKVLPFADKHTGLKGFIAIHRQNKNLPSFLRIKMAFHEISARCFLKEEFGW